MYCLQARPCIFQPGNFTGWGSEAVKMCSGENHFNVSFITKGERSQDNVHKSQFVEE